MGVLYQSTGGETRMMQRMLREAKAKREAEATGQPKQAKSRPARMTAADRERALRPPTQRKRVVRQATSVVLVGPQQWRFVVDDVLSGIESLIVAADVEGDPREVDIYAIPQGDVVLIAVNGNRPNYAIEFAMRLQAKDRGTCIALVLPHMSNQNLRTFHTYGGSWSLISAAACGDRERLAAVLESAGRGIPWVDPIVTRLLASFDHGTVDFDEEFDESAVSHYMEDNEHSELNQQPK